MCGVVLLNKSLLISLVFVFIYYTGVSSSKSSVPQVINWRDTVADTYPSITTSFSDVINENAPIRYSSGSKFRRLKDHTIKKVNLGPNELVVWQLCDAVDINMMGMDALDSIDTSLVKNANKKGFAKVCRLIDTDQLDALPSGSVYLLISDSRENIIASYIFNSDEMKANQDNYEEYQKSYGLILGAIVS